MVKLFSRKSATTTRHAVERVAHVLLAVALSTLMFGSALATAPQVFATAEAALEALGAMANSSDDASVIALFGDSHIDLLAQQDRATAAADRTRFASAYQDYHALRDDGTDRRIVIVGFDAWPFPIPLVKTGAGWQFAVDQGIDEIINRRIGRNELNAIDVLRAYVDAQRIYASQDRVGDGVLQYAKRIVSTSGTHDGLYWSVDASDADESPLGPRMADAAPYLVDRQVGGAYLGYHFRVLSAQGPHAAGGAYSYIINGRMVAGFAMVAYPARYGESGLMTFIVNQNGKVYERDVGRETVTVAARIRAFDPGPGWREVE